MTFCVALPAAFYVVFFTKIGFGIEAFYFLSKYYQEHAFKLGGGLAGFAFFLYLFDCYYWDSKAGRITRHLALSIIVIGIAVLVAFIASTHPYGPISMFTVLVPIWLSLVRFLLYRHITFRTYITWLSGPLFLNSMGIGIGWFVWTFLSRNNKWSIYTKLYDAEVTGCKPDFKEYPACQINYLNDTLADLAEPAVCFTVDVETSSIEFPLGCARNCTNVFDECSNTFIVWVGPFLVAIVLLFLSFFSTFLRNGGSIEKEAAKFGKVWGFLLFVMWISASLAGAGSGVSTTLAALTLSSFVASAIFLAMSYTQVEAQEHVRAFGNKLIKNYAKYLDIAKGLLVVTCTPVAALYLAISFLVQMIRNLKMPCSRTYKEDDHSSTNENEMSNKYISQEARKLIKQVKSWDLVTVFVYAVYWGIGFYTLTVIAAKFTTLFLSWLIEETKNMDLASVTGILFAVGVIMFLLPPVPGAPIYLTLGIVIVPVGRETLGLTGCIAYAMGISLVLKLFATFLQQVMIGGMLQGSLNVRQMVGINTPLIRGMKLALAEPGLGAAKICILCGGPDWPTSVLCGIMGLNVIPVLIGTLPVAILIIPTVLAGSFTYMSSEEEFGGWAGTAATICTTLAAMVLFGFCISAAYFVEQIISQRPDDLAALPYDEEVREADLASEKKSKIFKEISEWKRVPIWAQLCLLTSLATMITSCYMVQLFPNDTFAEYKLTDTIDKTLKGDWKNIVKPVGFVSIILFGVSILLLVIFLSWANFKATIVIKERLEKQDEDGEIINENVEKQDDEKEKDEDASVVDRYGRLIYCCQ